MELFHGIRSKRENSNFKKLLHVESLGFKGHTHLVIIRLPKAWILKLMTRVLMLFLFVFLVPWPNLVISNLTSKMASSGSAVNVMPTKSFPVELFPVLYNDFANEGFMRNGDKVLLLSNEDDKKMYSNIPINMEVISPSDLRGHSLIPEGTYDLMLVHDFSASSILIDRVLKPMGIIVLVLTDANTIRPTFQKPSNYKIIYLRRKFGSTILAMRKMYNVLNQEHHPATRRRLFGMATESKKAALSHLEDVLLEPPRAASGKSTRYLKKTKFLPDLIGDSLQSYPRRVFINVCLSEKKDSCGDENWFSKHYPTRNKKFEMYKIDAVASPEGSSSKKKAPKIGMSDWLRKNVKENEYVVMKAEAEVVEEMVKTKAIRLVDELFLECQHRGIKKGEKRGRRAYWECLALYGRLRDEGIVVHQWWG